MDKIIEINSAVNGFVWGPIMLALLVGTGIYLSFRVGFIQFSKIGYWWKNTIGKIFKKSEAGDGEITPLQAVSTALASTVGTGNIAHRVADILRAAFDVRVLCWNPRRTAAECAAWGYEQVATLPELFRRDVGGRVCFWRFYGSRFFRSFFGFFCGTRL